MNLKGIVARITLRGNATPATFATGGPVPLGFDSGALTLKSDDGVTPNMLFSARITAAANGNVGTLDLASRAFTQTTGFPTISGTSGKDFEGVTVSLNTLGMVVIKAPLTNAAAVVLASQHASLPDITLLPGQTIAVNPDPAAATALSLSSNSQLAFTFATAADKVDVHACGFLP